MERLYTDPTGMILPKYATNRHHAVWKKDSYQSSFEKILFREMGGMVLQLTIQSHRDLHANVEPPQKPNINLMRGLYNFNKELNIPDVYVRFEALTDMLGKISNMSRNERNSDDAGALHDNFTRQLDYINQGKLKIHNGTDYT